MPTITSTEFTTRAGSGTISIAHASLAGSRTFRVSGIGTLSIEFDMEQQSDDASGVFFLPANFEFSAFDKLSDGDSLFAELDAISSTDDIAVTFSFTTDGGWSWSDIIVFTKNDMEYDRLKREVAFECRYRSALSATITQVFNANTGDVKDLFQADATTKDCMAARDFIDNMLSDQFPSGTNINQSNNFSADPFDGSDTWVIMKDHDGTVFQQVTSAVDALYRLAATDGAVVGSMMGYNFFVGRLDDSDSVSVSEDDASKLKIKPGLNNYRSIGAWFYSILGTDQLNSWSSHKVLFGDSDSLNTEAAKDLNVAFYMLEMQAVAWNAGASVFNDDGFVFESDTTVDLSEDVKRGATVIPVSGDPSLSEDDLMTFSDKRELYRVDNSNGDRIVLKTPLRRDVAAEFSSGGNKSIIKVINVTRQDLSSDACDSYAKAYGADGSRLIEIDLLDIDTMKPHQTITADSSFPALVQGQAFRPSTIEYDIEADKIIISGYQIS